MGCFFHLIVLLIVCSVHGIVPVTDLNATNYVSEVSQDSVPWLVLFRTRRIVDTEVEKAVRSVATRVNASQLHVGLVDCEKPFCRDAFGIKNTPVLVLFHSGVWSVGKRRRKKEREEEWGGGGKYFFFFFFFFFL